VPQLRVTPTMPTILSSSANIIEQQRHTRVEPTVDVARQLEMYVA
jgi:hypothetical protein